MNRSKKWLPLLPVVLAVLLYVPALGYDFVYDDHWAVDQNPHLRIWPGLGRALTSDIWALSDYPSRSNYYRPMPFFADWIIMQVLSAEPWAFHLVNVVFHAAVVALVWLVSMNLFRDRRIAFTASVLFALHPIHTEAVAWIASIGDLGCTLFFMLALFLYTRGNPGSVTHDLLTAACYFISVLWKELGATFLPVIVAYDLVVHRQIRWRRYAPVLLATGVYFLLRYRALGGIVPLAYHSDMTLTSYPIIAAAGVGTYISKLFLPLGLSMYYPPVTASLGYAVLMAGVMASAVLLWQRRPEISWTLLWIVLTLSPALAVSRISMPISERNLYLASVGYCWVIALIAWNVKRGYVPVLLAGLACLFGIGTLVRLPDWRDDLTIYAATLEKYPEAGIIRLNLATELARRGRLPEAVEQLDNLLVANPSDAGILANKARFKSQQNDWQSVREICSQALAADPKSSSCLTLMAVVDQQEGDLRTAMERLDQAIAIDPRSYEVHYYRGNIYAQMGRHDDAVSEFKLGLSRRPTPEAFNNLGSTYFQMRQLDAAIDAYQTALKLDPAYTLARENLDALLEWRHGQPAEGGPNR